MCYTFLEPNYGDIVFGTFRGGNSQHPLGDVTHGEWLIKRVYESIRKSPIWDNSLLIVTWDEHGGFYDHVAPPTAVPPGDEVVTAGASKHGFTFGQYGPRVPAIAISPLIPKNLVDQRVYDHASIPATIERLFGLQPLTARDDQANSLESLATLPTARADAPTSLPDPAPPACTAGPASDLLVARGTADPVDGGNLPGFLGVALRTDLALSPLAQRPAILAYFKTIETRGVAQKYLEQVGLKVQAARSGQK